MTMDDSEMTYFKQRLEEDLAEIQTESFAVQAGAATVVLDQTMVGRLSRMDALQQQAMSNGLQSRLIWRQRRVQAALGRLLAGLYGSCCVCGEDIAQERLHADPSAPFCADCQLTLDTRRSDS